MRDFSKPPDVIIANHDARSPMNDWDAGEWVDPNSPVHSGNWPGKRYVRADSPKALAQALLDLWRPANVQQMAYPDSVPFRRYLNEIIKQGK